MITLKILQKMLVEFILLIKIHQWKIWNLNWLLKLKKCLLKCRKRSHYTL